MPHYKDTQNKIHFLDSPAYEYMLPVGSVQITDAEAYELSHPAPTMDELKTQFLSAVQFHIDHVANLKGYDSGVSCASYAADTHPPFAADAAAFIPWRSNVWLYCYAEWAKLEAGQRTITTAEAFISELPVAPW